MASMSGGEDQAEIEFSSMKQPPLIKQLKGILSEYPDGSQILKELIQNAEDAEASEVRILFNNRRINNSDGTTPPTYNRFFQGPSLCIYNDSVFTDKDWDGIRMIYSSIKEDDPLTVGRFGLGFKSVFHITDYPCVISGSKMLLIDPQQPADNVNAMIKLSAIDKLGDKGLDARSFWKAFDGIFGFQKDCAENTFFNGTMFWFPLREKKSEISETLYNETKVLDLFDVFEREASSILLFLKNLECISVSLIGANDEMKELAKAKIEDNTGKLKQSRSKFKDKIKLLASNYKGEDITVDLQMTILTTISGVCESVSWQIVNYFVGNSASSDFKKLIQDQHLAYSPYVGVALPLNESKDEFEGHVFCFLPLPHEGSKLTGLPVHVNGFFALSQNRHHLKWETDEQRGKKIDDKNILWNKCLIKEALPKAYSRLVQSVVETSTSFGNTTNLIAAVYRCLPLASKVQNRWKVLETELYKRIKKLRILYSKHSNKWVTIADASFASFKNLPDDYKNVQNAVIGCLSLIGRKHIEMPVDVFLNFQKHFASISDLTPEALAKFLHQNAAYKNLSDSDKLDLLLYLCSDGKHYQKVDGLELLPLANKRWITFKSQSHTIYIGTEEEVDILKGQENLFVMNTASLGTILSRHIEEVCLHGLFQIKKLTAAEFGHLLETTVTDKLGTSPCITDCSELQVKWLEKTWRYCIEKNYLPYLRNVHLVPLLAKGSWLAPEIVNLLLFSDMILVRSHGNETLPKGLCICFESVGVRVLESLPDWIPKDKTKNFFYWPSQKSILSLLTTLGSRENIDKHTRLFNTNCEWKDKSVFTACCAKLHHALTGEGVEFLKKIKIFKGVTSITDIGTDTSVEEINCYINETIHFPDGVTFSKRYLKSNISNESLLETLGASKRDLQELVLSKLKDFLKMLNTNEIPKFMEYFINNFHLFQTNDNIIESASKIQFLRAGVQRCKASDLYDPSDACLQDLLLEEALLPETKKKLSDNKVCILRILGLKGYNDITANVILKVAKTLDVLSKEKSLDKKYIRKALALMNTFQNLNSLLDAKCQNGLTLAVCLENLSCIPVQFDRVPTYPACVTWNPKNKMLCTPLEAYESRYSHLIGGVKPIVFCPTSETITQFKWSASPPTHDVITQLKLVCSSYTVQNRPDILPLIKSIYQHLSLHTQEIWQNKLAFANENIIWTGSEFATASRIIVTQNSGDLNLNPYYCFVPIEFKTMQQLFSSFGCRLSQSLEVLLDTLRQIRDVHSIAQDEQTTKRDRDIVCRILEKIATNFKQYKLSCEESDILVMVYDSDPDRLHLVPLPECTYDDDPSYYFENDENVNLVHELISSNTVEALGVKSISRKALMDAEELGIEEWGQQEPLTTRLHSLLRDGYTDGLSVPKELIQNADDAGASVVKFLYDERQNTDMRQRVFCKEMRHFQGPALWIYNNAQFTEDDMKNITKLNAATKQADVKKIGKFGLGFCSVYNLTDLPSFLSGSDLVFFDPHENHLGKVLRRKGTGLKYRLPNKTLVARHSDQFKPYAGIFGCNIDQDVFTEFKGSLFRLPLRTEQQAKESHISSLAYTHDEMVKLLQMLVKTAGNLLLFTQNVNEIELYHLPGSAKSASDQKLLYKIKRKVTRCDPGISEATNVNVLARIPDILKSRKKFNEIQELVIHQTITNHAQNVLNESDIKLSNTETKWISSWATGDSRSLQRYEEMSSEGAVPLSTVAVPCIVPTIPTSKEFSTLPCGFYRDGHIFCFLPLPLKTNLQFHINGHFAVTSDRRQLASLTDDDKCSERYAWNVALMEDALVLALLGLIQYFADNEKKLKANYTYYDLWPEACTAIVQPFKESFYKTIIEKNVKVFKGMQKWICFKNAVFLDPEIRESEIGAVAFEVLSHFPPRQDKTLIEMPRHVLKNIKQCNKPKENNILSNQVNEEEFFICFFETLQSDFWINRLSERNKIIYLALQCKCFNVKQKMRAIKCIPSEPNSSLARPCDLIHPNSYSAILFDEREEIFPLKNREFREERSLAELVDLGMNSAYLSDALLIDRCQTVLAIAKKCCSCARERFSSLIKYLSQQEVFIKLKRNERCVDTISDMFLFPVLPKPCGWSFSWRADSETDEIMIVSQNVSCTKHVGESGMTLFGKSKYLSRESATDLVGIVRAIVDESNIFSSKENRKNCEKLLHLLGINCQETLPLSLISKQVQAISEEYVDANNQYEDVARIHDKIFRYFEKKIKDSRTEKLLKQSIDAIKNCRFVLIGKDILHASNVAFNIKEEIKPHLYRLPDVDKINKSAVYSYLGVQDYFSIEAIVEVMTSIGHVGKKVENVDKFNCLLINLDESMQHFEKSYDDFTNLHSSVVAPDTNCVLWPTDQLVIENEDYTSTLSMKILHHSVSPAVAKRLGAKVKQFRCYQDIKVGISFGQREKLVTRIKGLLKAYPCDGSIMKELLQNADDAGATEIHFIKDYRNHSTKKLFHLSCKSLQGPSLCVFNNSFFTQSDIEGIHNLGQGSKSDDPTKTGQYGVGFNAVYHLTDTPSFITKGPLETDKGLMFIFDPLCKHVPQATSEEPGMMCKIADLEANFSDHLLGFLVNELINDGTGTVFRLPLRSLSSEISDEIISISKIDDILHTFESEMLESVLFLKNISRIKVSNITTGEMIEEYSVKVQMSEKAEKDRKSFQKEVLNIQKSNDMKRESNLESNPIELIYELDVKDTREESNHWLVIQRFGIDGKLDCIEEIKNSFKSGDLGLLPAGGVAIPMNDILLSARLLQDQKNMTQLSDFREERKSEFEVGVAFKGRAFCFLPLPIATGLPVHINGHFALDHEARRDLWKEGYRMRWNTCVINGVIIPAWISGLSYISALIMPPLRNAEKWHTVNTTLLQYHKFFPTGDCTSDTWTNLSKNFYRKIHEEQASLFPYILENKSHITNSTTTEKERFTFNWVPIKVPSQGEYYGVFNTVQLEMRYKHMLAFKDVRLIVNLLKTFGLKIVETPDNVRLAMMKAGIDTLPTTCPDFVISFLKTFDDHKISSCDIGTIGRPVSETKFSTPQNVSTLMDFMMTDKEFCNKMVGLPMKLTADGFLRVYSESSPVFISSYTQLLSHCEDMFVHDEILQLLRISQDEYLKLPIFQQFKFEDFIRLLPRSMDVNVFAAGIDISFEEDRKCEKSAAISSKWISRFYDFLCECSMSSKIDAKLTLQKLYATDNLKRNIDSNLLQENVKLLEKWSFLPSLGADNTKMLLQMKHICHILHLSYTDKINTTGACLAKFGIPTLYVNAFNDCHAKEDIRKSMENIVASLKRPFDLLCCLSHHRSVFDASSQITEVDGVELLSYFGRELNVLKKCTSEEKLVSLLSQLPFYLTMQGTLISLETTNNVLVLPTGMPFNGIQKWANACKIILLQEKESLSPVYDFLGLEKADEDYVYGQKILPRLTAMPSECWLEHITYLRDKLGQRLKLSKNQSKVIKELTNIAFITVNSEKKMANQLYDPTNETFRYLVNSNDCLPENMATDEWRLFLKKLGLKTDVSDDMIIMFARQVEALSMDCYLDSTRKKSEVLLARLSERNGQDWNATTLAKLRTIKFIYPFVVEDECNEIYPQFSDERKTVCFHDAVSSDKSDLCWSSSNLCKSDIFNLLDKKVRNMLGLLETPSVEKVVMHCQNIIPCLNSKLNDRSISDRFTKQKMTCLYEFFNNLSVLHDDILSGLEGKPLIHLPDENAIVCANDVVIELSPSLEIKPFLFKSPSYYGQYFDLFQQIGTKRSVMFCHYASILQKMKHRCKENELSVPERAVVKSAFKGLIQLTLDEDTSLEEVTSVFIPTRKMYLKNSKQVIISDKASYEYRLKGNIDLDMCVEITFLDITTPSLAEACLKWPVHLRPVILTDVITEEVCIEESLNQKFKKSKKARKLEEFLHSNELVTALCRLIKHQSVRKSSQAEFDPERTETEIAENLRNVTVFEFPALRTVLKYQDKIVEGSERLIEYYIQQENGDKSRPCTFFFNDKSKTENVDMPKILHGMIRLMTLCATALNADSIIHVTLLIQSFQYPYKLHGILDDVQIQQYGSPQQTLPDYFPKPGTYVEPQFIPFLEQGIVPFKDFEFEHVAMELEDISMERGEEDFHPVYIFVKILQEVETSNKENETDDLERIYIVETGKSDIPNERVPIYRLYRFIRRDTGNDLEVFTGKKQNQQLPVDEQCIKIRRELIQAWKLPENDRKRIVRRIILKWHPDKNRGNEEYCTKIFQYIQVILSRLENGEPLGDDVEQEMRRGKSHFSHSSSAFYENVFKTARTYARAYYDNFDAYSRSERTGDYAHSNSASVRCQDHGEAQRWLRQAKMDFEAALEMFPVASGRSFYNWICYICHQVCEKALKAAHYSNDANKVPEGDFLPNLALTQDMIEQASLLETRIGAHGRLRYPDSVSRPKIPSDIYTFDDAEFSLEIARKILEMVEEYI